MSNIIIKRTDTRKEVDWHKAYVVAEFKGTPQLRGNGDIVIMVSKATEQKLKKGLDVKNVSPRN